MSEQSFVVAVKRLVSPHSNIATIYFKTYFVVDWFALSKLIRFMFFSSYILVLQKFAVGWLKFCLYFAKIEVFFSASSERITEEPMRKIWHQIWEIKIRQRRKKNKPKSWRSSRGVYTDRLVCAILPSNAVLMHLIAQETTSFHLLPKLAILLKKSPNTFT